MTQRVDVLLDGKIRLSNLRSDNPDLWKRVHLWADTHGSVEVRRHHPTVPAQPSRVAQAQNVLFLGGDPLEALGTPTRYKIALSADVNHPEWSAPDVARQFRAAGHKVYVWGDCDQTPVEHILETAKQFEADGRPIFDGWWGQAETAEQFDNAILLNPVGFIGNLSALRDDQLKLIRTGRVLFIWERYLNKQDQQLGNFNSFLKWTGPYAGLGGFCAAVYASSGEGAVRKPLAEYAAEGLFDKAADSVYCPGMEQSDWSVL